MILGSWTDKNEEYVGIWRSFNMKPNYLPMFEEVLLDLVFSCLITVEALVQ